MKTKMKSDAACKAMYAEIRAMWGEGWKRLGDDLKRAIIAQRVLYSLAGMDEGTVITPAKISERLEAMYDYCGIVSSAE